MIGPKDDTGIVLADMSYVPENFSSEFKKEASLTTTIKNIGLDVDFDYIGSALVGQEDEIMIRVEPQEKNYIDGFRIVFVPQVNFEISMWIKGEKV